MYQSSGRLPHLLPASAYYCPRRAKLEQSWLRSHWHLVGSTAELARPGDYLTCEPLGEPIQIRNFDG